MSLTLGVLGGSDHSALSDAEMAARIMYALGREKDLLSTDKTRVPTTYSAVMQWQKMLRLQQADKQRLWRR
jgi:inhibitor of KinA sporulation pathway (predicted exonuclease)